MNPLSMLPHFSGMPMPMKIMAGVLGGGSVMGTLWFLLGDSPNRNKAMLIVFVGMVIVWLLFMAFKWIVKLMNKRKANPLSAGIAGNAAAAPQGISEPARRARLDDLRRNFEQGVEKFRAAGKNLYSVPWYVLVGEPGSGKTEAIRHCNVGFPPGLQDQLQGAGGTLNMNWWFTNSAIILDTAGRLMFEEVAPGTTNEWAEFLKLLKQNRPNCPINGMLLVIPVDTLIKDSADSIEKKAGKIAQQFDQIQRTLGVRFPVFVVISKCDLLNGFREYFDDLNDPQLQHQIMGWSNPAPLDERFDPAQVINHLESVKQRLFERRQNLLLDPVHTEDAQARRIDQVDALYSLPDSLVKIGPRLRRYLEMIFVAGEWSPKPLFLRGIYFTSSMTEGAALDEELATALGVPVDSLPGGAIFRKDRAYFLRDLFLEKVFREKGLVTRASNADKQQQMRRLVVLTCGFLAVITLGLVTFFSARSFENSMGGPRNWWDAASKLDFNTIQIINPKRGNSYSNDKIAVGSTPLSLPDLFASNLQQVKDPIHIPLVFRPMTVLSADVNEDRRIAYRALYERTVLLPLVNSTRAALTDASGFDAGKAGPALAQLMKMEYAKATGTLPAGATGSKWVDLDPMFAFIYAAPEHKDDVAKYQADKDKLQTVVDYIYTPDAKGDKDWPPKDLAGTDASLQAIKSGIAGVTEYWKAQGAEDGKALQNVNAVRKAMRTFHDAEAQLAQTAKAQGIDQIDAYHSYRDDVWLRQVELMRNSAKAATDAWDAATGGKSDIDSLQKLYEDQKAKATADANKAIDALLALTPPAENPKDNPSYKALLDARAELTAAKQAIASSTSKQAADEMAALDTAYFGRTIKGLDKSDHRRYEVYLQFYDLADKMVIKDDASVTLSGPLGAAFSQTDKDYGDAANQITQNLIGQSGDALVQAGSVAKYTIDLSGRARKYLLADGALKGMPDSPDKWEKYVQAAAAKEGPVDSIRRPAVPIVTFGKNDKYGDDDKLFSQMYAPDIAGDVSDKLDTITKTSAANDAPNKILAPGDLASRAEAARKAFSTYRDRYISYWKSGVVDELVFDYQDFKTLHDKIAASSEANITEQLKAYGDHMVAALNAVGATDVANAIKLAPTISPGERRHALSSWTNLPTDPAQVRGALLSMVANDFKQDYTVSTAANNESYLERYWNGLPVAALHALVIDGQKQIRDGIAELARYERFPLAPPGNPKDDLSLDDILAARKALANIRGAASNAAAGAGVAAGSVSAKTISQGGQTGNKDVDSQLDLLRGTNLLQGKEAYFDKLDRFLAAMPADKKPLMVTFTVDKKKLSDNSADAISNQFSYMPVSQGGKQLRVVNLISAAGTDDSTVEYAGGDLVLGFQEVPNGKVLQAETFSGPWAVLRLLKSPKVKSITREGNKWTVEYAVTAESNKKTYSIWFNLEFKQPLPDLEQWPVPPGQGGSGN